MSWSFMATLEQSQGRLDYANTCLTVSMTCIILLIHLLDLIVHLLVLVYYELMIKVICKFCDKLRNAKQNSAKWLLWMSSNNVIDI